MHFDVVENTLIKNARGTDSQLPFPFKHFDACPRFFVIHRRDPSRPFMTFMFFDSPHARYYFPPESVIEPDYLPELNYARLDLESIKRDIRGIRNRYLNSVNHLDSQLGRVFAQLEARGLLDNTLVVVTGDHGEEFLEKGRWGHNSSFVQEQLLVPLVLWLPGRERVVADWRTSHLDLLPTLLPRLGVTNPPTDYAVGQDLFQRADNRRLIAGDWDRSPEMGEDLVEKARGTVEEGRKQADSSGVAVECHVREGLAYKAIVDLAKEKKIEAIIMGSHGRTGLRRLLMGSVVEKVIGHTPCPVLVVKR